MNNYNKMKPATSPGVRCAEMPLPWFSSQAAVITSLGLIKPCTAVNKKTIIGVVAEAKKCKTNTATHCS